MRYKSGDFVIKRTGGNKMSIYDKIDDNNYKCIWVVEDEMREGSFNEDDIITLDEYKKILKVEERDDKINKVLEINSSESTF